MTNISTDNQPMRTDPRSNKTVMEKGRSEAVLLSRKYRSDDGPPALYYLKGSIAEFKDPKPVAPQAPDNKVLTYDPNWAKKIKDEFPEIGIKGSLTNERFVNMFKEQNRDWTQARAFAQIVMAEINDQLKSLSASEAVRTMYPEIGIAGSEVRKAYALALDRHVKVHPGEAINKGQALAIATNALSTKNTSW